MVLSSDLSRLSLDRLLTLASSFRRFRRVCLSVCFCNWISRGALQCLFAENIAIGPRDLNRSSTLYWAKSGGVSASWNFDAAAINKGCNFKFL